MMVYMIPRRTLSRCEISKTTINMFHWTLKGSRPLLNLLSNQATDAAELLYGGLGGLVVMLY